MKPTLRLNGRRMITVRVAHHIDQEMIEEILVHHALGLTSLESDLSRAQAERIIREELAARGNALLHGFDRRGYGQLEEIQGWASRQVARLWPELAA
jgi:hypothetical protein